MPEAYSLTLCARSPTGRRKSRRPNQRQRAWVDLSAAGILFCTHCEWRIQAKRDSYQQTERSNTERAKIKELRRENTELSTTNETLKKATPQFTNAELDRPSRKCPLASKSTARPLGFKQSAAKYRMFKRTTSARGQNFMLRRKESSSISRTNGFRLLFQHAPELIRCIRNRHQRSLHQIERRHMEEGLSNDYLAEYRLQ